MTVRKNWSPPGQSLSGVQTDRSWVIPAELWTEAWRLYYAQEDEERIGDIFWGAVRCPPIISHGLLGRLSRMDRHEHPQKGGSRPTRLETEVATHIFRVPMYTAIHHINFMSDPARRSRDPWGGAPPGPHPGEVMFCALRMQGYRPSQIYTLDTGIRLAKVLEAHVRDDRITVTL